MSKINIIDAICGAGKTQYAIQMMNNSNVIENKFIYITPFLKEVDRVKKSVTTRKFYEPTLAGGRVLSIKILKIYLHKEKIL
ncbi:hypothetical protein IRP63_13840 (plasmid) [Clostridium botulinum]|nr:hypothetical protein [Clostridium botulinum]QPW59134.1 hypothetical protein IRP63_13840 [Clostridium botulinum]